MQPWRGYQDRVATFFRELGLEATTDVRLPGARGSHDIDVLVRFVVGGVPLTWIVECKLWNRPVSKERVLVLAGIVGDVGADRGLLVAESGYQAGAIRVSQNANITLTSLADLREASAEELQRALSRGLQQRISLSDARRRLLWQWTLPECRVPAIALNDMLDVGSTLFALQMWVAPQLALGRVPLDLRVAGIVQRPGNVDEAHALLSGALTAVEEQLTNLEASVAERLGAAAECRATLDRHVVELVCLGRRLAEGAVVAERDWEAFVACMRAISDTASELRAQVPSRVGGQVGALMRRLVDSTYDFDQFAGRDWDVELDELEGLLGAIGRGIATAALEPR